MTRMYLEIESSEGAVSVLKQTLRETGYTPHSFHRLDEGMMALETIQFDGVFLEMKAGDDAQRNFVQQIRRMDQHTKRFTPIFGWVVRGDQEGHAWGNELGMFVTLELPCGSSVLRLMLDRASVTMDEVTMKVEQLESLVDIDLFRSSQEKSEDFLPMFYTFIRETRHALRSFQDEQISCESRKAKAALHHIKGQSFSVGFNRLYQMMKQKEAEVAVQEEACFTKEWCEQCESLLDQSYRSIMSAIT